MKVTREIIMDLLPVYVAGEASPATRALIEDPELSRQLKTQWLEKLNRVVPSPLPPELELKVLDRTRRLLAWRTRLFAIAFGLCALRPVLCSTAKAASGSIAFCSGIFPRCTEPAWWSA